MDILIQGSKLEFTLEKENNILEVLESLEDWLVENYKVIEEIKIDGSPVLPTEKKILEDTLISNTKLLEIKTNDHEEHAIKSLIEIKNYLLRLLNELNKDENSFLNNEKKDELIEGLKWIKEALINVCRILNVNANLLFHLDSPLSDTLSKTNVVIVELETYKFNPEVFKEIIKNKLKNNLDKLIEYFPKILSKSFFHFSNSSEFEIKNINENLVDVISTIDAFKPIIPSIGTNLQTGKEFDAYISIKNVISMMENLVYHLQKTESLLQMKYSQLIIDGRCVDDVNKDFNKILMQLSEAFAHNDIVLLSDLLEYELLGNLEIYRRIFEELIVITKKKSYN